MAKASPVTVAFPEFKAPEFKLPKFDLDAFSALQTANVAALHEVQSIVLEAAQAIAKINYAWFEETVATVQALATAKQAKAPEAVMADVKAVTEKAVAAGKQGMDLGVAAQQRVAELLTKRVQANIDEFKALAA
jgi:hypothetical protein